MKKKLLLADDSVTIQKVVQITFSHDDYELTVVDNGEIAYEKARSQRPDLILADVFMPGKNGYELCAAVKNDPALSTVPVLLLTGTFEPFDEAKARSAGADRWIAKPFESQALIACVEDLLKLAAQTTISAPAALIPTPPSDVPFAPATEAVVLDQPELAADIPEDIWGSDFPAVSAAAESVQTDDNAFAVAEQDDLWDVSGFEGEGQAGDDDNWGESLAPVEISSGGDFAPAEASAAVVDPWDVDDFSTSFSAPASTDTASEVLPLVVDAPPVAEEVEILDEIDLLEPFPDSPADSVEVDPFASYDFPAEEMVVQPDAVRMETVQPEADFQPEVVEFFDDFSAVEQAPQVSPPVPLAVESASSQDTVSPAPASVNAAMLNDAQLDLIVERVVEVVISRLAGTLLEKIAWEVVPDLAETMIKEELRKIRESVAVD